MAERRPRGRPRKDAIGWHALAAPPPPPSLPNYAINALPPMTAVHDASPQPPVSSPPLIIVQQAHVVSNWHQAELASALAAAPTPAPKLYRRAAPPPVPPTPKRADCASDAAFHAHKLQRRKAQKRVLEFHRPIRDRSGRSFPARQKHAAAKEAYNQERCAKFEEMSSIADHLEHEWGCCWYIASRRETVVPQTLPRAVFNAIEPLQSQHGPPWQWPVEEQREVARRVQTNFVTNRLPRYLSILSEDLGTTSAFICGTEVPDRSDRDIARNIDMIAHSYARDALHERLRDHPAVIAWLARMAKYHSWLSGSGW